VAGVLRGCNLFSVFRSSPNRKLETINRQPVARPPPCRADFPFKSQPSTLSCPPLCGAGEPLLILCQTSLIHAPSTDLLPVNPGMLCDEDSLIQGITAFEVYVGSQPVADTIGGGEYFDHAAPVPDRAWTDFVVRTNAQGVLVEIPPAGAGTWNAGSAARVFRSPTIGIAPPGRPGPGIRLQNPDLPTGRFLLNRWPPPPHPPARR
jgi:hypothetical protein